MSKTSADDEGKSFWKSTTGIITQVTGLVLAVSGLVAALNGADWLPFSREGARPAPPGSRDGVLFEESFDEESLNPFSHLDPASHWTVLTGDWYVDDGSLHGVPSETTSFGTSVWPVITLDHDLPDDYAVTFRTKIPESSFAELLVRLSRNRYVRAYIYNIDQAVMLGDGTLVGLNEPGAAGFDELMEHIGGGETLAQQGFPLRGDAWYTVQVTAHGDAYTIEVGGQEVISYVDTESRLSPRGTIGFASNSHVEVDHVTIRPVPGEDPD